MQYSAKDKGNEFQQSNDAYLMRRLLHRIKTNLKSIIVFLVVAVFAFLDYYRCLFHTAFGIPCPTCGVARAMRALLFFDLPAYAEYNAMAVPLIAALALATLKGYLRHKKIADACIYTVLTINTVYYIIRLSGML